MSFDVTVLGCGSATPTSQRNPTAQVINALGRFFLIDCGEGTQIQMRKFKIRFQKIDHVFISHLHGDHYFGLIGWLSTLHLLGRTEPLHIYANEALKNIMELQFLHSETTLKYKLIWHFLNYGGKHLLYEDKALEIYSFPLNHRIPTNGFLFKEKAKSRSLKREMIVKYDLSIEQIHEIKEGADHVLEDGTIIKNAALTNSPKPPRSYAFCSDTIYDEGLIEYIEGVDLLYHETTFMDDMAKRAKETFHTTCSEAGNIAKLAGVKQLMIGHFSARYGDATPLVEQTKSVFPNTLAAEEGKTYVVGY